jgi:hypothetical protein
VRPGRNTSSIIEIAARIELLRQGGHFPGKDFIDRVDEQVSMAHQASDPVRAVDVLSQHFAANESSAPPPVAPLPTRKLP